MQESKDWSFFFWGVELVDFGHFLLGGGVGLLGTFWGEGWVDVGGWGIDTKEKTFQNSRGWHLC